MPRDEAYILDMLNACRSAIRFTGGRTLADFTQDEQMQFAVIRALEVLGEAARRVSESYRTLNPHIPWRQIMGLRNRIAHEYDKVDVVIVWNTIQDQMPSLISSLEPLVPPPQDI